ncbi:glycosyltransferase family 4 protein [Oscillatoria sp. CS-180]|uniref:glycosyltransferase family 4 protein n=1 Tax=Oscillatoria sp. CS-180 TaxID=3021720 RepID=UPI00232AB298|nr:glycosyltransferase family 4 protein [Oscillatoria sp. CS-180]MDB9526432.1 glycosyltransferase family 4 protein [Oscillatoria sp. CS-180]
MIIRKVYIPIFSDAIQSKVFSADGCNPGVGGTQFTSIRLSLLLAKASPEWEIVLVNNAPFLLDCCPENLRIAIFENSSSFFNSLNLSEEFVVISVASVLKRSDVKALQKIARRIIFWSRHPFDKSLRSLSSRIEFKNIVCVGTYQFYSNQAISHHVKHIQNIFVLPNLASEISFLPVNQSRLEVVYLGALIPGKCFLEVARAWNFLKERFPEMTLHVIGSVATYGLKVNSDLIPTSPDFAKRILEYIPKQDIDDGKVVFHGNLGKEKFDILRKSHLAILNPKGYTEAFPASPLECMAFGTPVIASGDYGMSDCMRFFPELIVDGHKKIPEKVEWLVSEPLRYRELQQRSMAVAQWFDAQTDLTITRWIRLIDAVFHEASHEIHMVPFMHFYGSRIRLLYRQHILPLLTTIKSSF